MIGKGPFAIRRTHDGRTYVEDLGQIVWGDACPIQIPDRSRDGMTWPPPPDLKNDRPGEALAAYADACAKQERTAPWST